jgi:hypothetical protein
MSDMANKRFTHVEHKGKRIIYADYSGLQGEDLALQVKENTAAGLALAAQGETRQLVLVDIRDCYINQDVVAALKDSASQVAPYVQASAVVGVEGLRKHLLEIVNKVSGYGGKPFDTVEAAKDWLVSQ